MYELRNSLIMIRGSNEPNDFLNILLEGLDAGQSMKIFFDVQVGKTLHSPRPPNFRFAAHSRLRKTFLWPVTTVCEFSLYFSNWGFFFLKETKLQIHNA